MSKYLWRDRRPLWCHYDVITHIVSRPSKSMMSMHANENNILLINSKLVLKWALAGMFGGTHGLNTNWNFSLYSRTSSRTPNSNAFTCSIHRSNITYISYQPYMDSSQTQGSMDFALQLASGAVSTNGWAVRFASASSAAISFFLS